MTDARAEILSRVRRALVDRPAPAPVPRDYHGAGGAVAGGAVADGAVVDGAVADGAVGDIVGLFAERVADYRAVVHRCAPDEVRTTVAAALGSRPARRFVAPAGFPTSWLPAGALTDEPPLSVEELDALDAVLTTCAVAIAQTGTIVLDHGPGQGRRALTLVPDWHLVVVRADQIRPAVPDAVAVLDPIRPMTWISGPSATSDIELNRVEGVHGPRNLEVVIAG